MHTIEHRDETAKLGGGGGIEPTVPPELQAELQATLNAVLEQLSQTSSSPIGAKQ